MSAKIRKRGNRWVTTTYVRGKRTWISGPTKEAVEDKLAAVIVNRRQEEQHSEPIGVFAERWTRDYPRRKESTNLHNAERIKKFAVDFADTLLCDFTRVQARVWALENRSRWKTVRTMFADASRDGLCQANPFLDMRLQDNSRGRKDLEAPTEQDVEQLADIAKDTWGDWGLRVYSNLILTAAYTGMRPGELYGLRWDDIDWTAGTVTVERQFNARTNTVTSTKSDKTRVIPLLPVAHRALNAVPRQREEVFFTPHGKRFTGRVQHYYWHPVRCAFGRPDLDFYALRHAFGTMLANKGISPMDIAAAMGHQDGGRLAMAVYIHVTEKESRARIARAFGSNVVDLAEVSVAKREQTA